MSISNSDKPAAPPRRPQSASPPHQAPGEPPAADDGDEFREEEIESGSRWKFAAIPGWMMGAFFHAVLIVVLAWFTLPEALKESKRELVVAPFSEEEAAIEEFEPLEIENVDLENMEISTEAIAPGDIGMAALGEIAPQLPTTTAAVSLSDTSVSMQDVGALFGTEGDGMAKHGDGSGGAEFFGVKAGGRKFVFLVDSSKSMNGGKFEAACQELAYAISKLGEEQYFYVIFFDHDAARMTFAPNKKPEERAVPATPQNVAKLRRWMSSIELELKTNVYESFKHAMELMPDAIYVLTDGRFTDQRQVDRYLKETNLVDDPANESGSKVIIHTVGFYKKDGEPNLMKIASTYGGTYRFVPQPPKRK